MKDSTHQRDKLRVLITAALFATFTLKSRASFGYTVIGYVDGNWGCVGSCGGDDAGGYGDWSGSGDSGGGSSGGGGDSIDRGASPGNPIDTAPLRASGSCSNGDTREMRADQVMRHWMAAQPNACLRNEGQGKYYLITFADGWSGTYQWSGSCVGSTFMIEISFPTCH